MNQPSEPMSKESVEALYNDIDQYIEAAMQAVADGQVESLGELEGNVRDLCERLMQMNINDAKPFLGKLDELRERLDILQAAMEAEKAKIADEINANQQRQKATRAYRPPGDAK
jgi:hypothetical protein